MTYFTIIKKRHDALVARNKEIKIDSNDLYPIHLKIKWRDYFMTSYGRYMSEDNTREPISSQKLRKLPNKKWAKTSRRYFNRKKNQQDLKAWMCSQNGKRKGGAWSGKTWEIMKPN